MGKKKTETIKIKVPRAKVRIPRSLVGGGINRSAPMFKSAKDYTRKPKKYSKWCQDCGELIHHCWCEEEDYE